MEGLKGYSKITSTAPAEFDLTLETGRNFDRLAIKELQATSCYCGAKKKRGHTFCYPEYRSLPPAMQQALYNRLGHGYEEAYQAARKYFFEKEQEKKS